MKEIDETEGWEAIPGAEGLSAKLLSGDFDEVAGKGFRSRLVRFEKGGKTFEPFTHSYWEEVLLVEGEVSAGGETLLAPAYVIRPPGTAHGPFVSNPGCVMFEVQYFADRKVGVRRFLDDKAPEGSH